MKVFFKIRLKKVDRSFQSQVSSLSRRCLAVSVAVPSDVTSERQLTMVSEQAIFSSARIFILHKHHIRQYNFKSWYLKR